MNDTYLNAWYNIPPHNPDKLSAYLGKITRNLALNKWDYYNANKRGKGQILLVLEELQECISSADSTEKIVDELHFSNTLNSFLASLPKQKRIVFLRRYWYMSSIKEICADFGMSEKRILELFNNVDEKYIDEASPQNVKINKFMFSPIIVAACLCLLLIGGWGMSLFMQKTGEEKYYTTNMDEILAAYEGELLVEKISYEGASDTNILLCYTGNDLPLSSDEWKTLSVSASYEDYDMTLNCAFNGETFTTGGEKAIDTIRYGDTTIQIYQGETTPEFELTYYAVFEYQNVFYELKTYSNDKECIYEILQAVLGANEEKLESTSNGEHNFTEVLGYSDYYVTVEQTMPGFIIQKYYVEVDGVEKCVAQVYGYAVPEPEVYSRDLDRDGVSELICNCMAGTGAARVDIFRNRDGVIEKGHLAYDLWDETMFPGITNRGSSYIQENYIAETNTFEIVYSTETGSETIVIEGMDMFEFEEFVEEF